MRGDLLDDLPVPSFVLRGGRIARVSRGLAALLGLEAERIVGEPFERFVPSAEAERLSARLQARQEGELEPSGYETVVRTAAGREVPVEVRFLLRGSELAGVLIDLTDQVPHREQLEALARLGARVQRERTRPSVLAAVQAGLVEAGLSLLLLEREGDRWQRLGLAGPPSAEEALEKAGLAEDLAVWEAAAAAALREGTLFVDEVPAHAERILGGERGAQARRLLRAAGLEHVIAFRVDEPGGAGIVLAVAGPWLKAADVPAFRLFSAQVTAALEAARVLADISARATELAARNRMVEVSAHAPTLAAFFVRAAAVVKETVGCQALAVWLHDPEKDELALMFETGGAPELEADRDRVSVASSPMGVVLRLGCSTLARRSELPAESRRPFPSAPCETLVTVPLRVRSQVVGVMRAAFDRPLDREAANLALLEALAGPLAGAVEVQRLLDDTRRRVSALELLNDTALASAALDPRSLLAAALPRVFATVQADVGAAYLLEGDELVQQVAIGFSEETQRALTQRIPLDGGPLDQAIRTRRVLFVSDMARSTKRARILHDREGVENSVIVPLAVKDRPLGVLVASRRRAEPLGEGEVRLLSAVAAQLGVAVENARLFDDLRRSYADLERTQKRLVQQERLAALGEFSAVVAHEVRNPLAAIFNSLGSLQRMRRPQGDEKLLLDVIQEEADRLNRIVGDLLDFARPSVPSLQPASLEQILDETVAWALSRDCGIAVARDYAGIPAVPVDARLVRQALLNLIMNAVQAMPHGGELSVRSRADRRSARLEIADTGPGIPPPMRRKVFEPFFTTKATGTGLGLAVVLRVVEAHGGSVEVEDSPTGGALFVLRFPLASVDGAPGGSA